MARDQRKPGFALTEMERRTLIVLALLLVIGLVGKQAKRWSDQGGTVVIEGASPVLATLPNDPESVTLPGDDVSGSLAPSTSQDVPSTLHAASSDSSQAADVERNEADQRVSGSMHADESISALSPDEVRSRSTDLYAEGELEPPIRRDVKGRFDLNAATVEELKSIPGIGDVLASRVLDWRDQHGSFQRVEDLLLIEGIGDKRLATMKQYTYVQPRN